MAGPPRCSGVASASHLVACATLVPLLTLSTSLASQEVTEISWTPYCPSCEIPVEVALRIPGHLPDAGPLESLWAASRDSEGRLWASFSAAALVHVYDAEGRPLGRIGRRGSGPGSQ